MNATKRKQIVRSSIFITLSLATFLTVSKITVVATESIDATLMWTTGGAAKKGDYVNFTLDPEVVDNKTIVVTKIVACVDGELLEARGKDYYCNNQYIGTAKATGRKGQNLIPFIWNGEIPTGKVFLSGKHRDSFDSKYWGFANENEITRVEKII